MDCPDIDAGEPATVETQSLAAETSSVFERLQMKTLETKVSEDTASEDTASEDTASATSDDIDTDDDITDSSGLEDNSHEDSTILEESMLDAHDIPRSDLTPPPHLSFTPGTLLFLVLKALSVCACLMASALISSVGSVLMRPSLRG